LKEIYTGTKHCLAVKNDETVIIWGESINPNNESKKEEVIEI
jgi:alpha-tubulin suppressor-like RCC1 family protein